MKWMNSILKIEFYLLLVDDGDVWSILVIELLTVLITFDLDILFDEVVLTKFKIFTGQIVLQQDMKITIINE